MVEKKRKKRKLEKLAIYLSISFTAIITGSHPGGNPVWSEVTKRKLTLHIPIFLSSFSSQLLPSSTYLSCGVWHIINYLLWFDRDQEEEQLKVIVFHHHHIYTRIFSTAHTFAALGIKFRAVIDTHRDRRKAVKISRILAPRTEKVVGERWGTA